MLSAMFRRDYAAFRAQGLDLTPEDVVRLNALAVRVRLAANAPRTAHLPRLVFMPRDSRWRAPLVLREPTVAHELWTEAVARFIDCEDERNWLFVYAYALSRPADALPDATDDPLRVVKAVFRFAARRLVRFTGEQLSAAVEYCLFGADWTAGELGGAAKRKRADAERYPATSTDAPSPTLGLLADARALRLPLTAADAGRLTASELAEAVRGALVVAERYDREAAKADALADYCRARDEIRARIMAERAAATATGNAANARETGGQAQ